MTEQKTLSKDTNTALREITSTIKKMEKIFIDETTALNNIDNKAFMALQEQKLTIAREYQNDMGQILARKDELRKADPAIKNTIDQMQAKFSEISKNNLEAIGRMQRCTEKLGNTMRSAAIRAAQKNRGYSYSETGAISSAAKRRAISSGISESV